MEKTLSIIKPDATTRNITGKINAMIEEAGLKIVAQKMIRLSQAQAEGFYAEHKGKSFYDNLVRFMSSAPVVVQVLEAEDAITRYRKIMGSTNPAVADPQDFCPFHRQKLGSRIRFSRKRQTRNRLFL